MSDLPPVAGRYQLTSELGRGGMGRVWAARDELLGRDVAVKELIPPPGLSPRERDELRERAVREARAIARIDHPNVVRIFDVVVHRGDPWIVMELVRSRPLHEVMEHEGPMRPERVAAIGLAVLAALRAAHRAGLLHRDVKPANVLLAADGRVVLTDFGLAVASGDSSMTSAGIVLGSPSYLAPERALDGPVGPAADLWSLGATLYAAVEGTPPYSKSSAVATLAALATEPPRPPRRAGVLTAALTGLLAKDPAERIDAETAEVLLRQAAAGITPPPVGRADRRRRYALIGAAVALVVAAAAFAGRPALTRAQADDKPAAGPAPSSAPTRPPSRPVAALPPTTTVASRTTRPRPSHPTRKPATAAAPTSPAPKPAAVVTSGRPFTNILTTRCLDAADTGAVQTWNCTGTPNQRFDLTADGSVHVLGRCLQAQGDTDGAQLTATACTGAPAQHFDFNTSNDLVSLQSYKCVDVPDGNATIGTRLQIWECTGAANQKWQH